MWIALAVCCTQRLIKQPPTNQTPNQTKSMNLTKPGKELCGGGAHTACWVNLENGMLLKKELIEEGWW